VLDKITGELAKCAAGSETSVGTVSTFAAAFLFLNLAAMTGVEFPPLTSLNPADSSTGKGAHC
jgi:hypothetical protein